MENKQNWSLILSIIAISISFIIILIWIIGVREVSIVSLDTFIAAIATFIGVIATIIIGFQIINVLEIRNSLSKIKKENEEVSKKLIKMTELEQKLNSYKKNTDADLLTAYGFSHANEGRNLRSLICSLQSIITRLSLDISKDRYALTRINGEIFNMYKDMAKISETKFSYPEQIKLNPHWEHNIKTFDTVIRSSPQFEFFKTNYSVMYKRLWELIEAKKIKNSTPRELKNKFLVTLEDLYQDMQDDITA